MRTLRYSMGKGQRLASPRFSWVEGAGAVWRAGCRLLGLLLGVDDLSPHFGKRWAWNLRSKITPLGRYAERVSEKLYEVAKELQRLPLGERYAQVGEFCRQLAAF
ncbi:MAG: hypothetical protein ABMA26_16200 [Limisphaerales bacterium]